MASGGFRAGGDMLKLEPALFQADGTWGLGTRRDVTWRSFLAQRVSLRARSYGQADLSPHPGSTSSEWCDLGQGTLFSPGLGSLPCEVGIT